MKIKTLTLQSGKDKNGNAEKIRQIHLKPSESIALVGPTGSGKSELLSDIEQAASRDTRSERMVLVNGTPLSEFPAGLVATLSQKTNFVMDATVKEFILLHAESKGLKGETLMTPLLEMTNSLCGEPVKAHMSLQVLSGGQSRALMIADIAMLSDAPIVLIDEVENAGIHKFKALDVLTGHQKIVITATHDPVLILMNKTRLVMKNGGMHSLLHTEDDAQEYANELKEMDRLLMLARESLRMGNSLTAKEIQ